jgi:hypothetical protein
LQTIESENGGVEMTIKELVEALVTTESAEDRMSMVEANADLLAEPEAVEAVPNEWEGKYKELHAKYVRTFFHGVEDEPEPMKEPEPEKDVTIADLFGE